MSGNYLSKSPLYGIMARCLALLIAVDTLQAMAKNPTLKSKLYCPMIDARRMEVFTALYDSDNNIVEPISAKIIDETSFVDYLKKFHQ